MKHEQVKLLADGAIILAGSMGVGSSLLGHLNSKAAGYGLMLTFFFGCIATVFYVLTWINTRKAEQNGKRIDELEREIAAIEERIRKK